MSEQPTKSSLKASAQVLLLPMTLGSEEAAYWHLPAAARDWIAQCHIFFCENERTSRRHFKKLWKEMVIDDYGWHTIHQAEESVMAAFVAALQAGKTVGIISEAGLPCVADPGALLVAKAQQMQVPVRPLTGPSSLLLALMASGLNGQKFQFNGYLPIEAADRKKAIAAAENYSQAQTCTQLFIETPYRNDALVKDLLATLKPGTRLCLAVELSTSDEWVRTKTVAEWRKENLALHKKQMVALFLA